MAHAARYGSAAPSIEPSEDERWYVLVEPGDTKVLTLEQLDDLFRLDIIDGATRVWQPGMKEWLPLSVVAGLDTTTEEPKPATAPPPPSRRPVPPRKPSPPAKPSQTAPILTAVRVPTDTLRTPVRASSQAFGAEPFSPPLASSAAAPWSTPPLAAATPSITPESLKPLVLSDLSVPAPAPAERGSGAGRWLVVFAAVVGVSVTLYRNDVVLVAARAAGQETSYRNLESALGGPGFGTPRAVAELTAASLPPNPLAEPTRPTGGPAKSSSTAEESTKATSLVRQETPPSAAPARDSLQAAFAAKLGSKTRREAPPTLAAGARRNEAGAKSQQLGIKGSTSKYDPLNGKL